MKFSLKRTILSGLIAGMIVSFLFTLPGVNRTIFVFMDYLYGFLPETLARFLASQTVVTMTFTWFMIFVGLLLWLVRGDFFKAETEPREDRFEVVKKDESSSDAPESNSNSSS